MLCYRFYIPSHTHKGKKIKERTLGIYRSVESGEDELSKRYDLKNIKYETITIKG